MGEEESSDTKKFILYELLEYFVRKQEPELIKCKNDSHILLSTGAIKNALRYLNKRSILPKSLAQYVSLTLPWKFAVGDNGKVLAILQENILEIRRLRDEYSSVVAKASVPRDAFAQWRKLAWSPDGSILALSSSNGNVSFYNSFGNNIFYINSNSISYDSQTLEADDAVVTMLFKSPIKKDPKWDFEFIKVTYGGVLNSYNISAVNGYENNHRFDFFINFYTNGINGMVYCEKRNLFFVSGNNINLSGNTAASEAGLTVWRPVNDFPHYKLTAVFDDESQNKSRFSIWNLVPSIKFKTQTVIFKMSLNPSSEHLACLHMDGTVSIWCVPNLKLQSQWKLVDQPDYNVINPINGVKTPKYPPGLSEFHPLDIGWWSNQALVIARYSGAISTCSINNLQNLLGASPEFLSGPLQMVECSAIRGVLCLDCEINVMATKRSVDDDETITESDKETGDLEPTTIFSYATNILQSTLYSMTDIEKFQPKRRKSKIFYRTYRILGLKSTTPDELYSRKIEIEEYEEALDIANTYHLDKDLVYETQWRKSEFSLEAIKNHLSKVTKRAWVLNECVTRVPDNLIAARELLNFGLKKSSLQQMLSFGDDTDNNERDYISLENENRVNVTSEQAQKMNHIISAIQILNLNSVQKEIIRLRIKLLKHMDMLKAYEILLESPKDYDKSFYQKFRQMSPIANAVRFAKDGNCEGVILMFTYFENQLIQHWLSVISFFPEALDPKNYKTLLPRCDSDNLVYLLDQEELRQKDWSERSEFQEIAPAYDDNEETFALIYQNNPWFGVYRNTVLTQEILSDWYKKRCYEIERLSGLVDNALSLINIGKLNNIAGLQTLLIELETLDDLVYKVGLKNQTLDDLDKLTDLEKVNLLMSQVNEANFINHVENTLIPFARKKEVYVDKKIVQTLIQDYFVCLSQHKLVYIMEFVRFVTNVRNPAVRVIVDDYVQLAFNCMYSCDDSKMHNDARNIFDAITEDFQGDEVKTSVTRDKLEILEKELNCLDILANYEVYVPLKFIRQNEGNLDNIKLLFVQVCENVRKEVPPVNEKTWSQLLSDLLDMQESVFKLFNIDACLEIYLETRLKSGNKSTIRNCANLMVTVKKTDVSNSFFKVPYEKSVDLILQASHEYFNNATSLVDPNMDLARTCLHLIETDHKKIEEEFDLISSLQLLYDFHLKILPLQVKLIPDKLKLIEDCLNSRSDSYKNKEKLLDVAKCLQIDNNARNREGKVLHLVAKKAFQEEDFNYCSTVIRRLIELNHQQSWQVSSQLGRCNKFRDLKFRCECLWFVVNVGPDDVLQETIKYINVLDTEVLGFDLQNWVDLNQSSFEYEEFADAISSPNVENREFIPKVLKSSSKLVKDSTLIVTKSMIDIMKNKDFWPGNFANFLEKDESSAINEDFDDATENGIIQSLPCFYESFHGTIRISNLDTKYNGFVMKDSRNDKLKLCQTLLRVQLLKESSCNGEQISDISQLLIESAKHTITEDNTLALGYLLSLKREYIFEVKKLFANLPQTEFLIQLASYYYSIIIFKSLNSDYEKAFEYDPSNFIKFVMEVCENDNNNGIILLLKDRVVALENFKEKKVAVKRVENMESETDGWDDEWGDADWGYLDAEPKEIEDVDPSDEILLICELKEPEPPPVSEMSEDERYAIFAEKYSTVSDKTAYNKLKLLLQSWPLFFDDQYFIADKNPALKMALKFKKIDIKISEEEIFEEFRELLRDQIIPRKTLLEFLHHNPDEFTIEEQLFLKLRSDDSFQTEVLKAIKERNEEMTLPDVFLEEIFFQNLTPHFSPNHHIYHKIIETVFMNRTIPEIQENVEILINKLMEQKNVPHAAALLSQLESVPPSLCSYDSCFERLLSKR